MPAPALTVTVGAVSGRGMPRRYVSPPGKPLCGIVPVTGDQQMPERGFPNHVDDRRLYNGHILIPCQPAVDVMLEDRPRRC